MTVTASPADTQASFERPDYVDTDRKPILKLTPTDARVVLDIGCNRGGFGAALKRRQPCEVWGVEPDLECAAIAGQRLDHVIPDIFQDSNPLPDAYFDLICFNDSIEHMPRPDEALSLAKRKLKPGGRIQCCVPNMRHVECIEHLLFDRDWRYEEFGVRDRTHLRFFTAVSVRRLFEEAELKIDNLQYINEQWWTPGFSLRKLALKLMPRFTADMRYVQILVTAS